MLMQMQTLSLCNSNPPIHGKTPTHSLPWNPSLIPPSGSSKTLKKMGRRSISSYRRFSVFAVTEGSAEKSSKSEEESVPAWAKLDSDEPPPWARNETQQADSSSTFQLPYIVYLLASAVTAIAAIGSVFEYANGRPVFGVLNSDSIFYAPVLGFFAFTGVPTSAFLWFKSVEVANKEAEEQDRRDGYR